MGFNPQNLSGRLSVAFHRFCFPKRHEGHSLQNRLSVLLVKPIREKQGYRLAAMTIRATTPPTTTTAMAIDQ